MPGSLIRLRHGIAGRPGDAPRRYFHSADHISAANHNGNFDTELLGGDQIAGNPVDGRMIHAERMGAGKILARKLDNHPTIDRLSHC